MTAYFTPTGSSLVDRVIAEKPSDSQPRTHVLVVDDEVSARKLLCLILGPPAFQCVAVGSGEEALIALHRERFDAVITDLRMPGIDGMALIAEARRQHRHVAFLVTTGVDNAEIAVQAMRSGADDYLVKPITASLVLASIERALRKQQLEREVEEYGRLLEEKVAERTQQLQVALQRVEQSYQSTLEALGTAIDLRDKDTSGHSERVCRYSLQIAKLMDFADAELESLSRGAYLHDIGKLAIPDSILLKAGPLTPGERQIMQQHVQIGFEVVRGIPFLASAADIVLNHHEHFDGNGYPRGIKQEYISLGARIFSVADAFDAITSDRPYRRASTVEVAQETIRSQAGRQFDPKVVETFLSVSKRAWFAVRSGKCEERAISSMLKQRS
jgi:putative nucleotidyltransferase with HDIG domain